MTNKTFTEELKFLEKYNIPQNKKIELIENLYRLSHINLNVFKLTN